MIQTPYSERGARRYTRSFDREVVLAEGEVCGWKKHFRNVLRELIGILEQMAQNNPARFVFMEIDTIVKHCNRYGGKRYSKTSVEKALRILAWLGIIRRENNMHIDGAIRRGYIVAPHGSACVQAHGHCVFFTGPLIEPWRNPDAPAFGARVWHELEHFELDAEEEKWNAHIPKVRGRDKP